MNDIVRRMTWSTGRNVEELLDREYLVTNGLGGYASCSIAGVATRRYHGLLVASLPVPYGRLLMFNHMEEGVQVGGGPVIQIGGEERGYRDLEVHGAEHLTEFLLEDGIPTWRYNLGGVIFQKRILMPYGQNTVHVNYRVISASSPVHLELRPSFHFRPHGAPVGEPLKHPYQLNVAGDHIEIAEEADHPALRLYLSGDRGTLTLDGGRFREVFYRVEADRGYESRGQMWSPGYFSAALDVDHDATLIASTESWRTVLALSPKEPMRRSGSVPAGWSRSAVPAAREGLGQHLNLAADQFIITPAGRMEHEARAQAAGGQVYTVIAGYHWFTDWGRDTMISLEGSDAGDRPAGRSGLDPPPVRRLHPRRADPQPLSRKERTRDYTIRRTPRSGSSIRSTALLPGLAMTRRRSGSFFPSFWTSWIAHLRGTRFGIGVDPADGLLRQGAEGYQLTWMDAKVDDWVVTPRRGKAVEINALWYNALQLLEEWVRDAKASRTWRKSWQAEQRRLTSRSTSVSGTRKGDISSTSLTARRGTIRRCGPTRSSPFR